MREPDYEELIELLERVCDGRIESTDQEAERAAELIRSGLLDGVVDMVLTRLQRERWGGRTLLWYAAKGARPSLVAALLDAGADPNRELCLDASADSGLDRLPLMAAISSVGGIFELRPTAAATECVGLLLGAGANPDAPAESGARPLSSAVSRPGVFPASRLPMMRMLLEAGADPLLGDDFGQTAIAKAREFRDWEAVRLLRAAAAPRLSTLRRKTLSARRRKGSSYDPVSSRGTDAFVRSATDEDYEVSFFAARAPVEQVAGALARIVDSPRWAKEAHKSLVPACHTFVAVVAWRDNPWTICMYNGRGWDFEHDRTDAAELSRVLGAPVYYCFVHAAERYEAGEIVEQLGGDVSPESSLPALRVNASAVSAALGERGVFVPEMYVESTGYWVEVVIRGMKASDVERLDIVVLREDREEDDDAKASADGG